MKIFILLFLFFDFFSVPVFAQWLDGGRAQSQDVSGNGALLIYNGTMYFWNGENQFQYSANNGTTWTVPANTFSGANPHVKKFAVANGRVYAALNFGTGNGAPIYTTDYGEIWTADTLGAPGHALGWGGMPAVSDIYA